MTALVTSDLHLTTNPRDAYRHDFMKALPAMIKGTGAEGLIINGDLTEEKDRHPASLVNAIVGYIATCAKIVPVMINKGNHDYTDVDNPFFEFLHHVPNVSWINRPMGMDLGLNIGFTYFFPHTSDWKRDWKDHMRGARKSDWVFAHQTFEGTRLQSGYAVGSIPTDVFRGARVLCGDVHIPKEMAETITYIGAPYTVDFGDDYQGRVLLVDKHGYQSIPYTGRQKRFVEFAADSNDKLVQKRVNTFRTGDIVKVRVRLTSGNRKAWPDVRRMVQEWAHDQLYELHSVVPVIEKVSLKATAKTFTHKSDTQLLETFSRAKGLDPTTFKLGSILMRKV
jgi:hypothetical protein